MKRMSRLATTGAIVLAIATLASCSTLVEAIGSMINAGSIGWTVDAQEWKGRNNQVYSVTLPAGGAASEVWGTDVYTDDSSIGSAAVHKGLITFAKGGTVKIRILPGRSSYAGSIRNGVTSEHYDDWDGSFEFVTN